MLFQSAYYARLNSTADYLIFMHSHLNIWRYTELYKKICS